MTPLPAADTIRTGKRHRSLIQARKANLEWAFRGYTGTNETIEELAKAFDRRVYGYTPPKIVPH